MKKLFGTDGMRGEAGKFPLNAATIRIVGQSLAKQFFDKTGKTPIFITGRDTRESSGWIEAAFHAGATEIGAECVSAGIITTPGVAFLTRHQCADAGVVISASHNPFHDNGIKIFAPSGKKINEDTELQIEQDISDSKFQIPNSKFQIPDSRFQIPNSKSKIANLESGIWNLELQEIYLNYLAAEFQDLSLSGLKIVADCANGAAYKLAPRLLEKLGATVVAISNEPDGRNINQDCGSLHIEKLQTHVLKEKADLGVAFDGDADRALFVDERGDLVDGDATLWVMARHLQSHAALKNNTVVATVMSNLGLEIALKTKNIVLLRTKVGDKYVLEELLKTGTSLGGEQSGHLIFPERSLVGDGMRTALSMLEAMQENRAALSELTTGFVRLPQILLNVRVREKQDFSVVPSIAEAAHAVENELGSGGRLLLRYSGTEPLARVMIEGNKQEIITEQAYRIAAVIERELGV